MTKAIFAKGYKLEVTRVAGKDWYYPCYTEEVSDMLIRYRNAQGLYIVFQYKQDAIDWLQDAIVTEETTRS